MFFFFFFWQLRYQCWVVLACECGWQEAILWERMRVCPVFMHLRVPAQQWDVRIPRWLKISGDAAWKQFAKCDEARGFSWLPKNILCLYASRRDLLRVGVTLAGHQKKILHSIQALRVQASQSPTATAWLEGALCPGGGTCRSPLDTPHVRQYSRVETIVLIWTSPHP